MAEAEAVGPGGFPGRMVHMLNEGMLALMVSVGHRTGLFDVMAGMPAATSAQIASAAALDERYVREWLAANTGACSDSPMAESDGPLTSRRVARQCQTRCLPGRP